jgi:hypothetical protein
MSESHPKREKSLWKKIKGSRVLLLIIGLLLFGIKIPLDFIHSGAIFRFSEAHKNLVDSIAGAAGFFAAAVFFSTYFRERASRRQDRIYTVAYRSLVQVANDAIRKLLAPLNGMNLYAQGVIPEPSPQWEKNIQRLKKLHRLPPALKSKAILGDDEINGPYLRETLIILLKDRDFVEDLYLINARVRRETQNSTGLWAPIMLTSSHLEEDLGRFRTLNDDLEHLQQHLRELRNAIADEAVTTEILEGVQNQFWTTILNANAIFKDFASKADFVTVEKGVIKIDE